MFFKELLVIMSIIRFLYLLKIILSSKLTDNIRDYTFLSVAYTSYFIMSKVGL